MKVVYQILLVIAIIVLTYFCVMSVVTPIRFEEVKDAREVAIIDHLIKIRTAEVEYKLHYGRYTADLDSLILFLRTVPKKEVRKEGSLTDKQLEGGLTEHKAVKIIEKAKKDALKKRKNHFANEDELYNYIWANDKDIQKNGLSGFKRDTIESNMIATLFKGQYDEQTIESIIYIPYSGQQKFQAETNDNYKTAQGISVPLLEVRAPFTSYLSDQDRQELVNLQDKEEKLQHYPGLKIGDITSPNNNAGNWE